LNLVHLAVLVYAAAIICANLLAAHYGPSITPYVALTLVGIDLSVRDWLQVQISRRQMAMLIPIAGMMAYLLNPAVRPIAIASTVAFIVSEWAEWGTFTLTSGSWFSRSVKSNTVAAAVDSLIFPALAFHAWLPWIVLAQFLAKTMGSTVWAYCLQFVPMRRRS
jgi:hypothetical protein